jgi:A1 cistron-splicing factor AAR2
MNSSLEHENLSPEEALRRLDDTASLVCLGVPQGTEFGIDLRSWVVGEHFQGLKLIPPGLHYVYWRCELAPRCGTAPLTGSGPRSSPNVRGGASSPRTGQFVFVKAQQVLVQQWNVATEDLCDLASADDVARVRDAVAAHHFDRTLGTYPSAQLDMWHKLTAYITLPTLARLSSPSGRLSALADELPPGMRDVPARDSQRPSVVSRNAEHASAAAATDAGVPSFDAWVQTMKPRFSAVPERLVPPNCSAQERTRHMLDKSFALNSFLETSFGGDVTLLLGELQFSFVAFLAGHAFAGFEQWRRLVMLVCAAQRAVCERPGFFYEFVASLHAQMEQAPPEFFDDAMTGDNFLVPMLAQLFDNALAIDAATEPGVNDRRMFVKLQRRMLLFKQAAEKRFGREFNQDDADADEDGPTIVEL